MHVYNFLLTTYCEAEKTWNSCQHLNTGELDRKAWIFCYYWKTRSSGNTKLTFCMKIIEPFHLEGLDFPSFPQSPTLPAFFLIYTISFCSLTWSVWHLQALKFSTTGLWAQVQLLIFIYKDHLSLINFFRPISHIFSSWTLQFRNTVSLTTLWFLPFPGLSIHLKSLPCLPNYFFFLLENVFLISLVITIPSLCFFWTLNIHFHDCLYNSTFYLFV